MALVGVFLTGVPASFGGGITDGWFLVLDLSRPTPPPKPFEAGIGGRMTYRRAARRIGRKPGMTGRAEAEEIDVRISMQGMVVGAGANSRRKR